jgi:hypothetical protein
VNICKEGRKVINIIKASLFILILILALTVPVLASVSWSSSNNLSNDGNGNDWPAIAQMQNNDVWAVWQKSGGTPTLNLESIVYNSSNCTWSSQGPRVLRVNAQYGQNKYPFVMQTRDGTVWVLWSTNWGNKTKSGDHSTYNYDIVYRTSTDYGTTWGSPYNITSDYTQVTYGHDDFYASALQLSNGTIWVVWEKNINSTNTQIYYRTAPATGSPWSPETSLLLNKTSRINNNPSIVQATNGSIILFWSADVYNSITNQEIMYQVYNGTKWKPEQKLTNDGASGLDDTDPSAILTRTGAILVVWQQTDSNDNKNIVYATNNGKTWSTKTSLTTDGVSTSPSVTQGNDKRIWIAYVYADETNYLLYVYCKTSDPLIIKADLNSMNSAFGSTRGNPKWDYGSDLDKNGIVNAKDLYVLSRYYGNSL